ncbi:hypothetical protein [Dubosiella muris]|uniref:Uncharacterized protein n=2 Tax=Dubosiella TaxID=1937008 RepID=A0AC61R576_9FIRM|nr:hypothetical protein [Dubosiella muris]TGY65168.1 hypothetical protein E5336_09695 [Dubosiella muris]
MKDFYLKHKKLVLTGGFALTFLAGGLCGAGVEKLEDHKESGYAMHEERRRPEREHRRDFDRDVEWKKEDDGSKKEESENKTESSTKEESESKKENDGSKDETTKSGATV